METKKELNIPPDKKVVLFLVWVQWAVVKDYKVWDELLSGLGDDVIKIFKWHPKVTYSGYKKDVEGHFKEKYPSRVKVYQVGPPTDSGQAFSREFCGGPHVVNTREIGKFVILKEEAVAGGTRRIRATVEP